MIQMRKVLSLVNECAGILLPSTPKDGRTIDLVIKADMAGSCQINGSIENLPGDIIEHWKVPTICRINQAFPILLCVLHEGLPNITRREACSHCSGYTIPHLFPLKGSE